MSSASEVIDNLTYLIGKAGKVKAEDLKNVYDTLIKYLLVVSEDSSINIEVTKTDGMYSYAKKMNDKSRLLSIADQLKDKPCILKTNWEIPYEYCTRSTLIVLKTDELL